jgi:F420-dependent oxidoreductase-like protein
VRFGIMLPVGPVSLDAVGEAVRRADKAGFASAWLPNTTGIDALTALALAGRTSSHIELATCVVPIQPRHPVALAQHALTVQAAIGGRLTLGVGLSHRALVEDRWGLDFSRPVLRAREYLAILNALLDGQEARFEGELYQVNAQLGVPGATRPQVIVAALGPQMLRLTGRLADGTVTWMGGLRYLRNVAVPEITAAAEKAGRPRPRIAAAVPICLTPDAARARERANRIYAVYNTVPSYRATLERGGAAGPGDVAVAGTEAEIAAQLREYEQAGVTDLVASLFHMPGEDDAATYELVASLSRQSTGPPAVRSR